MHKFEPIDPLQRKYEDFIENVRQTFESLGGTIVTEFSGDWAVRIQFGQTGVLDVTAGPGGHPIVGRGGGMMVFPRTAPRLGEFGPEAEPTITSSWAVLGAIVQEAIRNAAGDADPAITFGNTINFRLGTRELRDGEGFGAQFLPYGFEDILPQAALRSLASTMYAEAMPLAAMREVYPGYVAQGEARGGLMPIVEYQALSQAAIGGVGLGGGKARQSGIRPYETAMLGKGEMREIVTATGLPHQAQIHNVLMPISGAIGPAEGQVAIAAGTQLEQRRPIIEPLTGWTTDMLSQITRIRQGAIGRGGSEIEVLMAGQESMYSWQSKHWSYAQIAGARISLPESYAKTTWWQGLPEEQRGMFELSGGAVAGGRAVPSLVMDVIGRRAAGGTVSGKGGGQKALGYEENLAQRIVGGLSEAELARTTLMYEEGPKEWFTRATMIGTALNILGPDKPALIEAGKLNRPVAEQIAQEIARRSKTVTEVFEVTPGLAEPYLSRRVPGVIGAEWLSSGNLRVTRETLQYAGPSAEWMRIEYPMAQSKLNPEEIAHIQATNPALYARIQQVGYLPEAHMGVSQAFWASYGQIDRPAGTVNYEDVRDVIQGLAGATGGERGALVRAMAEQPGLAASPIAYPGGMILPSAQHMLQMSATNIAGEEVSKFVGGWERALLTSDPAYLQAAADIITGPGWVKELQSVGVPGVAGPGVGRGNIPVGEVYIGENQLAKLAREVYGHNPSQAELARFRQLVETQDVIGKMTRFPQSDVYTQNELYLRLRIGGGANEIATNPLIAAIMRGDYDADIYRWFTTSVNLDPAGELSVSNVGMGEAATERSVLTSLIGMMEAAAPAAVAKARAEVAELGVEGPEETRLGAILSRVNYFANEYRKHVGKEVGGLGPGSDVAAYVMEQLANIPGSEAAAQKQEWLYEAKGMMGRTYNALRRSTAERARQLYGPDSPLTRQVFAAAAGGYQPALDVGTYSPTLPLGSISGDVDPAISFGTARLMEAFGTMSFLHGGGFMANITGTYQYGTQRVWENDPQTGQLRRVEKRGFAAPWVRMQGEGVGTPLAMMRNILGQAAMFGGEYTPEQMAAMLAADPETQAATQAAVAEARQWAGTQEGTAEEMLRTSAGLEHLGAIWRAAGMTGEAAMWQSQAPLIAALRDTMLMRTREQMYKADVSGDFAYQTRVREQLRELDPTFKELTGVSLESEIEAAVKRQASIGLMAGDILATGRSPVEKAQALAGLIMGEQARPVVAPQATYPIWPSSLGQTDARLFASLLQQRYGVSSGWGGIGTAVHAGFESVLREQLGDQVVAEEQMAVRGTLRSLFGMESDVGFSGRPDILVRAEGGGYSLFDIKSYEGPYDPRQLQIYAAALGQRGYDIRSASYLTVPPPGEGVDPAEHAQAMVKQFMAGGLTRSPVELAETQEGRLEVARGYLTETLRRRSELEPLLGRIAESEAQALGGMGYTESGHYAGELLRMARRRAMTGVSGETPERELTPLERLSADYGIDLARLGVEGASVLEQDAYAKAVSRWGKGKETSGGFTQGREIVVRQASEEEAKKYGIDIATLTRRRLAHEAGHVAAAVNPELMEQAKAQLDEDLASGKLSQTKLQKVYGDNWREKAASERIAMGIARAFGALDTYGEQVDSLDILLNKIGSRAIVGSGAIGGIGGEGGGEGPPPSFLTAPSGGGGIDLTKLSERELGQFLGQMARSMMGWDQPRDVLKTTASKRLAFEIAGGNLEAMGGPTAQGLIGAGRFEEVEALQRFQKYMLGPGGAPTGSTRQIAYQLRQMAGSEADLTSLGGMKEYQAGLTPDVAKGALRNIGAKVPTASPQEALAEFSTALAGAAKRVEEHGEQVLKATRNYEQLNREQQKAYKDVMRDVASLAGMETQLETLGPAGEGLLQQHAGGIEMGQRIQAAMGTQQERAMERSYSMLSGRPNWTQIRGTLQGIGRDLISGWGMMRMSRLWGLTGGRAFDAQKVAMQEEMAVQGAIAGWSGGGGLGPVSQGLLGMQATQSAAQAAMGRGAYMAYGSAQRTLAGMGGELAGVGLPALGAGIIGATLISGPVGLAAGLGTAIFGGVNYLRNIGSDQAERDYRMGGGFFSQTIGQLGDMIASGRGTLTGALRSPQEYREMAARGQQMRSGAIGAFAGDPGAQAITMRHWSEQMAKERGIVDPAGWANVAGQWQAHVGDVANLNDLPTEMLANALTRGYSVEGMAGLARALGGTSRQFQPLMEAMVAAPKAASTTAALAQYAAAGQAGLVGMDYFAGNIGNLQEMTGWQANRFAQMMAGDRGLWSRYAAGQNLGLTGTAQDILGQVGRQPWMMAAEPATGYALHTTTGAAYGGMYGALETQEAQQGGMRGIQWAFLERQREIQQQQQGRQWNRFQMGYAYQTGAPLAGYPGEVPAGLMGLIGQTGGMWGLQDTSRTMGYNWQQYQFGYQGQMMDMSNRFWQENWQARWNRLGTTQQWEDEQNQRQQKRYAAQDEHWLFQWGLQENMAQLRFGWGMEDLDESIRFTTGRQKLRLMRQKERATVSESMRRAGSEEDKDYWEKQREWRDEDMEDAKEKREQQQEWAREDMERAKRQHNEQYKAEQEHFERTKEHYQEQFNLESRRIQLEREYWRESQKAQAEDLKLAREIDELQIKLRADQLRLSQDSQDAVARLNIGISELGAGIDAVNARIGAFNTAVAQYSAPATPTTPTTIYTPTKPAVKPIKAWYDQIYPGEEESFHEGGPVGVAAGMGQVDAKLETGEYVVPKGGALVMRDERVVDLLDRIARLLEEGNGRFTIMVKNPERGVSNVHSYLDAAYRN